MPGFSATRRIVPPPPSQRERIKPRLHVVRSQIEIERELTLFRQIQRGGTERQFAINDLMRIHEDLVCQIARKFENRGLNWFDLRQEVDIGLWSAIEEFAAKFNNESFAREFRNGTIEFQNFALKPIREVIEYAIRENNKQTARTSLDAPISPHKDNLSTRHNITPNPTSIDPIEQVAARRKLRSVPVAILKETLTDHGPHQWQRQPEALSLILQTLSPELAQMYRLIYIDHLNRDEIIEYLGSKARHRTLRKHFTDNLSRLQEMYDIVEEFGLATIRTPVRLRKFHKIITAARKYLEEHPGPVPVSLILREASISETEFYRLKNNNEEPFASLGIAFRSSLRGANKEAYILQRIEEIEQRIRQGESRPRNLSDLRKMLGVGSANTMTAWRNCSDKTRAAIETLFRDERTNNKPTTRLHRMDQMPAKEKPAAFAEAYQALASGRDLGREPIKIAELATALGYSESNIYNWINSIPRLIRPNMILDLSGPSRKRTVRAQRRRRIKWALNYARKEGLPYASLNDFIKERLNITRGAFNLWKKTNTGDPELMELLNKKQYQ